MSTHASNDITRIVLMVLLICLLLAGSLWTMLPFLGALIWATTIVVATWPVLLWIERRTGNRRKVAVVTMTVIVSAVFITPFCLVVVSLLDAIQSSPAIIRDFLAEGLGPPPSWVSGIPLVGERIAEQWQAFAAGGADAVVEAVRPYMRSAGTWAMSATGGIGITLIHVLFIIILVAILYAQGETAARGVLDFGRRLGGERGEETVKLAGQAVRSVALGVIVTALVQSTLSGIGLWASGIPHAAILTAIIFVLGIAQLGPVPILLPAIAWLYWTGQTGWATALLVWSLPVIALDNVLRPLLIRRGVQLPMLLIIAGVIGGLIGFGVLGLFVGPVVLAATYTLTKAWIAEGSPEVQRP